jgi:DNA-binding protein YbaB
MPSVRDANHFTRKGIGAKIKNIHHRRSGHLRRGLLKGFVSPDEQGNIFSREKPGVLESIERLRKSADLSLIELGSMRKYINSKSGNIKLVISGAKIILSLEINRDFLSSKNKNILEAELRDSVNAAIQEVENDIGKIIKSVEAGFYESVNRG